MNNNLSRCVRVVNVSADSPAYDANIQNGDIILKINNKSIHHCGEVIEFLQFQDCEEIKVDLIRGDKILTVELHPKYQ